MRKRIRFIGLLVLAVAVFLGRSAQAAPSNDAFTNSGTPLSGAPVTFTGSNVDATGESGEPNHAGASWKSTCTNATTPDSNCESSVWWTWTPTASGAYTVDLCASTFDTTLAAYSGSAVNMLAGTELASDDQRRPDACSNPNSSKIVFTASALTPYHIAVAGYQAAVGSISGAISACTATLCPAPTATTGTETTAAPDVGDPTVATLNGSVNPQGQATNYHFEYGPTTGYGTSTTSTSAGQDSLDHAESARITALTAGTTYHFRIVATNATGTTNGSDQTFTTPPAASTGAASGVIGNAATLNGTVNPNGKATTYQFEYGTTTGYGSSTASASAGSGTTNFPAATAVSALTPGTTYHFRIDATNSDGLTHGADATFMTPKATTMAASSVTGTGATLNGTANSGAIGGVAISGATYHFDYGTSQSYGTSTTAAAVGNADTPESATVASLAPATMYHFQIVEHSAAGDTTGGDQTFTTPKANTSRATLVTGSGATLNGTVNSGSSAGTPTPTVSYHFDYGTTTGYGTSTTTTTFASDAADHAENAAITSLAQGTLYHFRIVEHSAAGDTNGADETFSTPKAVTSPPTVVTGSGATLNGTVNAGAIDGTGISGATYQFQLGTTTSYGTNVPVSPASVAGDGSDHVENAAVTGLSQGTTYHFRIVETSAAGTTVGGDATFGTPKAATSAATAITDTGATLNGTVNAGSIPAGATGIPGGTYQFQYDTDPGFPAPASAPATPAAITADGGDHVVAQPIASLSAHTTYYFRLIESSAAGNTISTPTLNFTTNSRPVVATLAATQVTSSNATLNGTVNPEGASTTYLFKYDTTSHSGNPSAYTCSTPPASAGSDSTAHNESASLTRLTNGATYFYVIEATNATGTSDGAEMSFTAVDSAPHVTTNAATLVTGGGATLNGTVNPQGYATTYQFQYGVSPTFTTTVPATPGNVGSDFTDHPESATISGLTPGTTYIYRLNATSSIGTTNGSTLTFTTPNAVSNPATSVTGTGATLNGSVNAGDINGTPISGGTYHFDYGPTTSYGTSTTSAAVPADDADHAETFALTGLAPATTVHFRIVESSAAGDTTGADQTFTTPNATSSAATAVTGTAATLNGSVNSGSINGAGIATVTYHFDYGTDTSYGTSTTATSFASDGADHAATVTIPSGLSQNTTYHFRVVESSAAGDTNGADRTFMTPEATTSAASNVTGTGATFNGTVASGSIGGTPISGATYHFEYGTDTSYGTSTTATSFTTDGTEHPASADVTGLSNGTTYHVRLVEHSANGDTFGSDQQFTTPVPPAVTTDPATSVTGTTATLNGTVNPEGQSTTYHFEYGTTTAYGTSAPSSPANAGSDSTSHAETAAITGLTTGTTYHFRLDATNATGTTNGTDRTFTTLSPPAATTTSASSVTGSGATLNGMVNPNGQATTYHFDYGTTTSYGTSTSSASAGSDSTSHAENAAITGLSTSTTYHFRIVATNATGTTNGADLTFTTPTSAAVTTTPASSVTLSAATLNGSVNPQGSDTTYHFDYGTTTSYGSSTTDTDAGAGSSAVHASAAITGLSPHTVYHFRVVATSVAGTVMGGDEKFETCGSCGDFNTDGRSDVLFWNKSTGATQIWYMGGTNGVAKQSSAAVVPDSHGFPTTSWVPVATGDFNQDGNPDILYWNKVTGVTQVWLMSGNVKAGAAQISPMSSFPKTTYVPVGVADFDRDGHPDILYWNKNSGVLFIWFMGGTNGVVEQSSVQVTPDSHGFPKTYYVPVAASDVNRDGKPDVLYRNSVNGVTIAWFLGGTQGAAKQGSAQINAGRAGYPSLAYLAVSTADFDLDGGSDILYWNKNNGVLINWFLGGTNGVVKQGSAQFGTAGGGFLSTAWMPIR